MIENVGTIFIKINISNIQDNLKKILLIKKELLSGKKLPELSQMIKISLNFNSITNGHTYKNIQNKFKTELLKCVKLSKLALFMIRLILAITFL